MREEERPPPEETEWETSGRSPRKGQETESGEKERRGTRRDEPGTRKRKKGLRPKETIRWRRTREKKSKMERTATKSEGMKPEGTRHGDTQGQGERYPEWRTPELSKETSKIRRRKWQRTGKAKATNNPGRSNERKTQKSQSERHPPYRERNESIHCDGGLERKPRTQKEGWKPGNILKKSMKQPAKTT